MPLTCYMCDKQCLSAPILLNHYRLSHAIHYVGCSVRCGQDSCPRKFESFKYLKIHLEKHHISLINDNKIELLTESRSNCEPLLDDMDTVDHSTDFIDSEKDECREVDLTEAFMQLIGQLECKSNITHANIQVVVDNIQGFMQDVATYCKGKIRNLLLAVNVSHECPAADVCLKEIECLPNFLHPIDTDHKRTEFLKQCGTFIEPVEIVLSPQCSMQYSAPAGFHKVSVVEDTMQ